MSVTNINASWTIEQAFVINEIDLINYDFVQYNQTYLSINLPDSVNIVVIVVTLIPAFNYKNCP